MKHSTPLKSARFSSNPDWGLTSGSRDKVLAPATLAGGGAVRPQWQKQKDSQRVPLDMRPFPNSRCLPKGRGEASHQFGCSLERNNK